MTSAARSLLTEADHSRSAQALPWVEKHSCFLIYSLPKSRFPAPVERTLDDLAGTGRASGADEKMAGVEWLTADARDSITAERGQRPVWESGSLTPGNDLHPYVQRLLGGGDHQGGSEQEPANSAEQVHATVYRLTESALKLVHGKRLAYPSQLPKPESPEEEKAPKELRRPQRLALRLGQAARTRIERRLPDFADDALGLEIVNAQRVDFRTGHGFLIVELRFSHSETEGLAPYLMVEGLYALSRFNRLTWRDAKNKPLSDAPSFDLGTLARCLVGREGTAGRADRVFTASYLQFRQSPNATALDQLLTQLSRHYNDDYRLRADLPGIERVSLFDNVSHCFSLEGCATAVDLGGYEAGAAPEFLENYLNGTYRRHYLPITLLAYHEFQFLLHTTNDSGFWPNQDDEGVAIERMRGIRQAITNFMLCFRFSYVSRVSMHNDVNRALRSALGLDWMLAELSRDSAEIDAFLDCVATGRAEALAKRHERRFRWASVIGVFGISWLTTHTITESVLELRAVHDALHLGHDQVAHIAAGVAIGVAVVTALVTAFAGGHGHKHGNAKHALDEIVIGAAKH